MPFALNQGQRIHYEMHGEGRPVVLLHGGAVSFAKQKGKVFILYTNAGSIAHFLSIKGS